MECVELFEYQSSLALDLPKEGLQRQDYQQLSQRDLSLLIGAEGLQLSAGGTVGLGLLPPGFGEQKQVIVLPKGARHLPADRRHLALLRFGQMLALVADLPREDLRDDDPSWKLANTLPAQILLMLGIPYARLLEDLLQRDYRRFYMAEEQEFRGRLRGHLIVPRHIHNALSGHSHWLPCRYEDFTVDHWDNRILKAALRVLRQAAAEFDPNCGLSRQFRNINSYFGDVKDIQGHREDQRRARLHRVSRRYRNALVWAVQILNAVGTQIAGGNGSGLWIKAPPIFESLAERVFEKAVAGEEGLVSVNQRPMDLILQRPMDSIPQSKRQIKPDLSILRGDKVCLVGDAKYKDLLKDVPNHGGLEEVWQAAMKPADLYQMYAYLRLSQCGTGVFVLPYWQESDKAARMLAPFEFTTPPVDGTGSKLWVLGLNLLANPRNAVDEGAAKIKELIRPLLVGNGCG